MASRLLILASLWLALCGPVHAFGQEIDNAPLFQRGARRATLSLGGGSGWPILGSTDHHDLALARIDLGYTLTRQWCANSLLAGHVEISADAFAGAQFNSHTAYLAGIGPTLRYNFTRGSRLVPFIQGGIGILATDIETPDLSGTFQFHEHAGFGAHLFLTRRSALTADYRFIHISNAGISQPNRGANTHLFSLGFTWFF